MGWWLDRLIERRGEVGVWTVTNVASAIVFDRAGVTPMLAGPLAVLDTRDLVLQEDVHDLLRATLGEDGFTPFEPPKGTAKKWRPPAGRPLVALPFHYDFVGYLDGRHPARGTPMFIATPSPSEHAGERALRAARIVHAVVDGGVARAFADALYGPGRLEVVGDLDGISDLVLAAGVSKDRASFELNLARVTGPDREKVVAQQKADDAEREADEAPPASEPRRMIPKLSEMKGFGDARDWGLRLAADLRAYGQGEIPWDDVDKGVLLSGPPGCGKTTFAKALAAEVDAHFEALSYTDLEDHYVIKVMRKKFESWRALAKKGPVVVFFDEIDSFGVRGGNGHNDGYWSSLINALLDFLDGVHPRDGIVFVAATNFLDRVDPALRRAGRLDRHVVLPRPSIDEMRDVVAHHLGVDRAAPETRETAVALRGQSPADVALWAREARRMGRMLGRAVDGRDLADVYRWTRPPVHPRQDALVCLHEAGHAAAAIALGDRGWRLTHVDVDAGVGDAGGAYQGRTLASRPPWTASREDLLGEMAYALAGMAAEEAVMGAWGAGCVADLQSATLLAGRLIREVGMDGTLAAYEPGHSSVDDLPRVEAILREGLDLARRLVAGWRVRSLAGLLAERRYVEGDEAASLSRERYADRFFRAAPPEDDIEWPVAA